MNKYRMAMVFQSGALLNSLTVGENVGFISANTACRLKRFRKSSWKSLKWLISKALKIKMPNELSGGEKARISLARS
jgi:phospholipid/cholesterol/gamma-HCH transport system ATP-binding protein